MEDQGKRLLLAVAVAFAIMLLWNVFFPPAVPDKKAEDGRAQPAEVAPQGGAGGQAGTPAPPAAEVPAGSVAAKPPTGGAAAAARGPEQTFVLEGRDVRARFSSWGGVLTAWELLGPQFHQPQHPDRPEDLVRMSDVGHRPFAITFSDGSTHAVPAQADWRGEKKSGSELVFAWQSDDLSVEKRYRLHPEDYLLELDVTVEVKRGSAKQGLVVSLFSYQDPNRKKGGFLSRQVHEWTAACDVGGDVGRWDVKAVGEKVHDERGAVDWGGFLHSYFAFVMAPRVDAANLACRAYPVPNVAGGMGLDIAFPLAQLEAGPSGRLQTGLIAYLGPNYLEKLQAVPAIVGVSPGFEKAVDLGFWGVIVGPLLWLLNWFHDLIGSWGIAIILLTMTVKLATLYWTHKSMKSMKEMARLRPQLDKIRDKYKEDRQKQQVETMNLFKAHGVNPLAGCLPMLLQMPIWLALYKGLSVAAHLYQAKFLWLADLTAPDPYFILPVFMTGAMLLQGRLTPTTGTGMQQKMLQYGMPGMFGVMSLFFASGLALYIATNTMLSLLHHLYMKRSAGGPDPAAKAKVVAGPSVSGRKSAEEGERAVAEAVTAPAARAGADSEDDAGDKSAAAVEAVRNGQRPRSPNRGNRPGRRGGRRKRSSRSS